jgi:hypothetical protein
MVMTVPMDGTIGNAVLGGKRAKALPCDDSVFDFAAVGVFAQDAGAGHFAPSFCFCIVSARAGPICGVLWIAVSKFSETVCEFESRGVSLRDRETV